MIPPTDQRSGANGEQFIILQMVQDGSITPEEGARLLEAMDRATRAIQPPLPPAPMPARNVRILITNARGENEVDLSLPVGLVEMGLTVASKIAPGRIPDFTEVRRNIKSGFTGQLIDVHNGNDRIQISIQ